MLIQYQDLLRRVLICKEFRRRRHFSGALLRYVGHGGRGRAGASHGKIRPSLERTNLAIATSPLDLREELRLVAEFRLMEVILGRALA